MNTYKGCGVRLDRLFVESFFNTSIIFLGSVIVSVAKLSAADSLLREIIFITIEINIPMGVNSRLKKMIPV
jgi:hypothetical protein